MFIYLHTLHDIGIWRIPTFNVYLVLLDAPYNLNSAHWERRMNKFCGHQLEKVQRGDEDLHRRISIKRLVPGDLN